MAKTYKDRKDFIKDKQAKKEDRKTKGRDETKSKKEILEQMIEEGLYGI